MDIAVLLVSKVITVYRLGAPCLVYWWWWCVCVCGGCLRVLRDGWLTVKRYSSQGVWAIRTVLRDGYSGDTSVIILHLTLLLFFVPLKLLNGTLQACTWSLDTILAVMTQLQVTAAIRAGEQRLRMRFPL